ncbi:MAG: VWA domain-containing protein, partial [Bacteroidetes bacterium]
EPRQKGTNLAEGIRFLTKILKHNAIVFMLSDFDTSGYDKALKTVAKRHDCIGIHIYDRLDYNFPNLGLVPVQDAETGQITWIDSADTTLRDWWKKSYLRQKDATQETLVQSGWDYLPFATNEDYVHKLQSFFLQRMKR